VRIVHHTPIPSLIKEIIPGLAAPRTAGLPSGDAGELSTEDVDDESRSSVSDTCVRLSQTRCVTARPPSRSAAGRRCGYAFSYDEHCGRLVADSMQVFASTQSLDRASLTATALRQTAAAAETTALDVEPVWCSASDVDVDLPAAASRRLDVLTE